MKADGSYYSYMCILGERATLKLFIYSRTPQQRSCEGIPRCKALSSSNDQFLTLVTKTVFIFNSFLLQGFSVPTVPCNCKHIGIEKKIHFKAKKGLTTFFSDPGFRFGKPEDGSTSKKCMEVQ